jgi:hypothetical protein
MAADVTQFIKKPERGRLAMTGMVDKDKSTRGHVSQCSLLSTNGAAVQSYKTDRQNDE